VYNLSGEIMKVIKIQPQGFCKGVQRALVIVKDALKDDKVAKPLYILGLIVHNKRLAESLAELGVISLNEPSKTRLELLNLVKGGTVILTAHGVSPAVIKTLKERNIPYIDATCPDVDYVHQQIKHYLPTHKILYLGQKNHPETEGVLGISNNITLISSLKEAKAYRHQTEKPLFLFNQTTLDVGFLNSLTQELQKNYSLSTDNNICKATLRRQKAVIETAKSELLIVVGDRLSSNSNKLVEVAKNKGLNSYLIETVEDLKIESLLNIKTVSVTSGASTPKAITAEVIEFLTNFDANDHKTWENKSNLTSYDILG